MLTDAGIFETGINKSEVDIYIYKEVGGGKKNV
jgi:hypothetical protein